MSTQRLMGYTVCLSIFAYGLNFATQLRCGIDTVESNFEVWLKKNMEVKISWHCPFNMWFGWDQSTLAGGRVRTYLSDHHGFTFFFVQTDHWFRPLALQSAVAYSYNLDAVLLWFQLQFTLWFQLKFILWFQLQFTLWFQLKFYFGCLYS